jgi:hypothetical protein
MPQTPTGAAADDELAQLSLFAPLAAVATEATAVSPWHEPLPHEWSAPPSAIEPQLRSATRAHCIDRPA